LVSTGDGSRDLGRWHPPASSRLQPAPKRAELYNSEIVVASERPVLFLTFAASRRPRVTDRVSQSAIAKGHREDL